MSFNLFDLVKLTESIPLTDGGRAEVGTVGAIVEVFNGGEAYLIELFGDWVKYDEQENFVPASPTVIGAFRESIGVETVYPHQLKLVRPARETVSIRAHLLSLLDNLSTENLSEVRDFAEFLSQKQQQASFAGRKSEVRI